MNTTLTLSVLLPTVLSSYAIATVNIQRVDVSISTHISATGSHPVSDLEWSHNQTLSLGLNNMLVHSEAREVPFVVAINEITGEPYIDLDVYKTYTLAETRANYDLGQSYFRGSSHAWSAYSTGMGYVQGESSSNLEIDFTVEGDGALARFLVAHLGAYANVNLVDNTTGVTLLDLSTSYLGGDTYSDYLPLVSGHQYSFTGYAHDIDARNGEGEGEFYFMISEATVVQTPEAGSTLATLALSCAALVGFNHRRLRNRE